MRAEKGLPAVSDTFGIEALMILDERGAEDRGKRLPDRLSHPFGVALSVITRRQAAVESLTGSMRGKTDGNTVPIDCASFFSSS